MPDPTKGQEVNDRINAIDARIMMLEARMQYSIDLASK